MIVNAETILQQFTAGNIETSSHHPERFKGNNEEIMKKRTRITAIIAAAAVASALAGCGSRTGTAGTSLSETASAAAGASDAGGASSSEAASAATESGSENASGAGDASGAASSGSQDGAPISASAVAAYEGPAYHIDTVCDNVEKGDKDYVAPASIYYPVISLGSIKNGCFESNAAAVPYTDAGSSGTQDLSALQKALNDVSDSLHESNRSTAAVKADGSFYEEDGMSYIAQSDAEITRFDDDYFGMLVTTVSFIGGAHGYTMHAGYNFDTKTGEKIEISDVLNDPDAFPQQLADAFGQNYPDAQQGVIVDDVVATFKQEMAAGSDYPLQWSFTDSGIRVYINAYDITAYAAGSFTLDFDNNSYPGLIKDQYTAALQNPAEYFESVQYGAVSSPVDNEITLADGSVRTLNINYGDEMYEFLSKDTVPMTLKWGSSEWGVAEYEVGDLTGVTDCTAAVAHRAGKLFLYIDLAGKNDIHELKIYELGDSISDVKASSSAAMNSTDALYGLLPANPDYFCVANRCTLIGTCPVYRYVTMNEDGSFSPVEKYYTFKSPETGAVSLTAKTDVTAKVLADDADEKGTDGIIPSGTKLSPYRTDLEGIVDLKAEDGTIYRVQIDSTGNGGTIDGTGIEELFNGVPGAAADTAETN